MKISIVTATYNSQSTIRDTLESVLSQTYSDFEHIIVDGLSSDDTLAIIKEYEPQYKGRISIVSEPDKGIYDAMNKGIARATGDVVGILNSDDMFASPQTLQLIADGINGVEAVYGDLNFVKADDTSRIVRFWKGSQHKPGAFLKAWHPAHPTFYARTPNFHKYGGFDLDFNVSADFELMLRFLEANHLSNRYIPHTLVNMRMGGESTGSIKNIIQGNKNVMRAFKKNNVKPAHFYLFRRLAPKAINLLKTKLSL